MLLPEVFSACRVYADGKLVASSGSLSPYEPLIRDFVFSYTIDGTTELLIQTENHSHYYSGIIYPPAIGTADAVSLLITSRMLFYAFLCATSIALALFASAVWFGMRKESSGHENLWLGIFSLSFAMRICYPFLRAYGIPLTESLYALEDFMAAAGLLCISRIISSLCLRKNSAAERLLLGVHIGFLVLCGTLPLFVLRLIPGFIPVYGNLIYFFKAADALILLALLFRYCIRGDRKENLLLIAGMSCYASALGMHAFFLGQFEPARFGWFDKWAGYVMILLFSVRMILQNFRVIRENYRLKYHLEEEVDRKTKILKELLEERRMLLSAFAHDMKTPITSINNFTRLVEIDNDDLDEESRHYLDTIRKKTVEMQENLNMIHEFSRHDTPLTVLEPVDLIRLTTEFYENNSPDIQAFVLRFELQLPDKARVLVSGDPGRLTSVLQNLVYNAVKFTEENGMIRICLETDAANVYLQISDNGSGIPEENLPHIFERSFTRRSGHNGQGLGLFLVKSIVTEHGGTVEVQSAPGKGSTFTVCLPLLTGPADGADV